MKASAVGVCMWVCVCMSVCVKKIVGIQTSRGRFWTWPLTSVMWFLPVFYAVSPLLPFTCQPLVWLVQIRAYKKNWHPRFRLGICFRSLVVLGEIVATARIGKHGRDGHPCAAGSGPAFSLGRRRSLFSIAWLRRFRQNDVSLSPFHLSHLSKPTNRFNWFSI